MIKDLFCLNCEHCWKSQQHKTCPECNSEEIMEDTTVIPDWDDGHHEGEMGSFRDYGDDLE